MNEDLAVPVPATLSLFSVCLSSLSVSVTNFHFSAPLFASLSLISLISHCPFLLRSTHVSLTSASHDVVVWVACVANDGAIVCVSPSAVRMELRHDDGIVTPCDDDAPLSVPSSLVKIGRGAAAEEYGGDASAMNCERCVETVEEKTMN